MPTGHVFQGSYQWTAWAGASGLNSHQQMEHHSFLESVASPWVSDSRNFSCSETTEWNLSELSAWRWWWDLPHKCILIQNSLKINSWGRSSNNHGVLPISTNFQYRHRIKTAVHFPHNFSYKMSSSSVGISTYTFNVQRRQFWHMKSRTCDFHNWYIKIV